MVSNQSGKTWGELLRAGIHDGAISAAKVEVGFVWLNIWNTIAGYNLASFQTSRGMKKIQWAWQTVRSVAHLFWATIWLLRTVDFRMLNSEQADVLAGGAQKFMNLWIVGRFFGRADWIVDYALHNYDLDSRTKALLYVRQAEFHLRKGNIDFAGDYREDALKLLPDISDPSVQVRILRRSAVIRYYLGGGSGSGLDELDQAMMIVLRNKPNLNDQIPKLEAAAALMGISVLFSN